MAEESGPIEPVEIPKPPKDWWEQVPVLRELYKLLSSDDPVNWDLARQVAVALGSHDEPAVPDPEGAQRELEAMSRGAETECEAFTGLAPASVAPVRAVTRAQWVEANLDSFRFLMDPLANKLTGAGMPGPLPEPAGRVLRQVSGVLLGLQTGFVLGYLSRHVAAQYEVSLPEPEGGRLLYVLPNLHAVETDWELDPREFRYWIALH
jgi:putative hydrolase